MSVEELIKRIEAERIKVGTEVFDANGMLRLQSVMETYKGEYELIWSDDLLKELESKPKVPTHATGIKILDDVIGGFKPQQLITLGGDSAHGKTSWGLFFLEKMAELNPVMIPLEQSNEEIVSQRKENGYSIPRFLSPKALADRVTVEWIEERVVEGIAKHNTKFVVIDHLGYINDFGKDNEFKRENTAYRVGQVMKGLKNIAKRWNVTILLLVHISQHDEGKPPSREDIKNSSDIAQESDMVMMVWRKNTLKKKVRIYEDKTMLSIQKNRRTGRNANLGFEFDREVGGFKEENAWVDAMVKEAEREVSLDNEFDGI